MPLEIKEWNEHRDSVVRTLRGMQWEFKHDLQKMASTLNDKHKKIQLLEHEINRRPTMLLKREIKKERELLKEMLVIFNQQLLIARLTNIGKS